MLVQIGESKGIREGREQRNGGQWRAWGVAQRKEAQNPISTLLKCFAQDEEMDVLPSGLT